METIKYKNISFTSWDVGGRDKIVCFMSSVIFTSSHPCMQRPIIRHYLKDTNALVFVVDSNDRYRIDDVKEELWRMLGEDELRGCIVMIMANKQDLPNALSVKEITDKLELHEIKDRSWCKLKLL